MNTPQDTVIVALAIVAGSFALIEIIRNPQALLPYAVLCLASLPIIRRFLLP